MVRPSSILFLLRVSFRARWRGYLWVVAGMAVGMLALSAAAVFGLGLGRTLDEYRRNVFPENRVLLRPRSIELVWLQVETASITPQTLEKVRRIPGVRRVSPEATIRFPISAEGTLAGTSMTTDITVTGVESWLLGKDVPSTFTYRPNANQEVPAVLASYFLDLYNTALAESNQLPKLSPSAVIGRRFRLRLGESSLRSASGESANSRVAEVNCRIVGLSRDPNLLGLLIPLETVEAFNEWYGIRDKKYRALHVELESPEALDALKELLPALGLELADPMAAWRRVMVFVRLIGWGFVAFGMLVFLLSLAYLASSVNWILAGRRRERGIFQALGATAGRVAGLLSVEIGLVSALGIALGLGVTSGLLAWANHWYSAWRLERPFLPETLFSMPWSGIALLGAGCWALAILLSSQRIFRETRGPIMRIDD